MYLSSSDSSAPLMASLLRMSLSMSFYNFPTFLKDVIYWIGFLSSLLHCFIRWFNFSDNTFSSPLTNFLKLGALKAHSVTCIKLFPSSSLSSSNLNLISSKLLNTLSSRYLAAGPLSYLFGVAVNDNIYKYSMIFFSWNFCYPKNSDSSIFVPWIPPLKMR